MSSTLQIIIAKIVTRRSVFTKCMSRFFYMLKPMIDIAQPVIASISCIPQIEYESGYKPFASFGYNRNWGSSEMTHKVTNVGGADRANYHRDISRKIVEMINIPLLTIRTTQFHLYNSFLRVLQVLTDFIIVKSEFTI